MQHSTQSVSLDRILPPSVHLRDEDDHEKLSELAHSLLTLGQLQNIVLRSVDDHYELIAGRRRYRAAKLAGMTALNALVLAPDEDTAALQELQENLFRVPLSPLEEADAIGYLHYERRWEIAQIAQAMHKSSGWVENRISLLNAPDDIKAAVKAGQIGLGVALELGSIPDETARAFYLTHASEHGVTVDMARRWRIDYAQQASINPQDANPQGPRLPPGPITPEHFTCGMCAHATPIAHIQILRLCPSCLYQLELAKQEDLNTPTPPP